MKLTDLEAFANSAEGHITKIAITREGARRLLEEIEAKDETPEAFGLTEHVRERQTINMLHSTCEKVKREERGVI